VALMLIAVMPVLAIHSRLLDNLATHPKNVETPVQTQVTHTHTLAKAENVFKLLKTYQEILAVATLTANSMLIILSDASLESALPKLSVANAHRLNMPETNIADLTSSVTIKTLAKNQWLSELLAMETSLLNSNVELWEIVMEAHVSSI